MNFLIKQIGIPLFILLNQQKNFLSEFNLHEDKTESPYFGTETD